MKSLSIASLCTVLTVFVVTFVVSAVESIGTVYSGITISLLTASVAATVTMVVVIAWALPLHYVLKKLKRQALHWYLLASVILSVIFIYGFKPFGHDSSVDLAKQALFCSIFGLIGAAVFWYMAVYRSRITRRSSKDALTRAA
jgi:hypothetical protein